jgi:hypothetical protein
MGFSKERVEKIIARHDATHDIKHDDLLLRIVVRHSENWSDCIVLQLEPHRRATVGGRIYHDWLDKPAKDFSALELFKWFVAKFGMTFSIGSFTGQLLLAEKVPFRSGSAIAAHLVRMHNPMGHFFAQSLFITISPDKTEVDVAMAVCIDLTAYGEAVKDR